MRTTVRIDDDLLTRLKLRAEQENASLTKVVNRVLRAGLSVADRVADTPRHEEATFAMGSPKADLTRAASLAAGLEDEETVRKLMLRK